MRRILPALLLGLAVAGPAAAQGLLVPTDHAVPPLTRVQHHVTIAIEDQVAVTKVVQTFQNPTDRPQEADYVFPVPKGASVKKFAMWVDGKEIKGELVEAEKARTIYTDIVSRTRDPGLLEYMGNNLLRLRVFPVPAHGEQKLSLSYTSVAECDAGLVEYVYPLRGGAKAPAGQEKFSLKATLRSQHPIQNVYSPSHAVTVKRPSDREAHVAFEQGAAAGDRDFQLFYTPADKDVAVTALPYRPAGKGDGYVLLLISPRAELARTHHVARDMVFVLDTSGSMMGPKMEQARKALKFCLGNLDKRDRFALINFATTVNQYQPALAEATPGQVKQAAKWVDRLEANGGTAIDAALSAALALRSADTSRTFTVVFFTDGQPTIGETNPDKILQAVAEKNTANTRIFTFGVGDDVNAVLLDQLANRTRAVSTYVRPEEDIEAKVSSLYAKISHPVLTNLKLSTGDTVQLTEVYPAQLPDLFHGSQLVVAGRYHGKGHTALTLTGDVGKKHREFVYEVKLPRHTGEEKAFVEDLWARRKVGYLLDQIRTNGEKKELVDEVVSLAKKHGITTPYTSYLVVPDSATPNAGYSPTPSQRPDLLRGAAPANGDAGKNLMIFGWGDVDHVFRERSAAGLAPVPKQDTRDSYLRPQDSPAALPGPTGSAQRIQFAPVFVSPTTQWAVPNSALAGPPPASGTRSTLDCDGSVTGSPVATAPPPPAPPVSPPPLASYASHGCQTTRIFDGVPAGTQFICGDINCPTGKQGVDFAVQLNNLRNQAQQGQATSRQAAGRTCLQFGTAWIDEGFNAKMRVIKVKAQSAAYFRILERHPEMKEVYRLGNQVVWVTPSGCALVIDGGAGKEKMSDKEIDKLFAAAP